MKAIEFIREFHYLHRQAGFIGGSYALHLELGTGFNDIDYYTTDMYLGVHEFLAEGLTVTKQKGYPNSLMEVLKVTGFSDYPVNLMLVKDYDVETILSGFDLSILRLASTSASNFTKADIKLDDFSLSVQDKIVEAARKDGLGRPLSPKRVDKYKERLPEYKFKLPNEEN